MSSYQQFEKPIPALFLERECLVFLVGNILFNCTTISSSWRSHCLIARKVVLGALVVESPGCGLAKKAMREMTTALPFFEEGSKTCRPPSIYVKSFLFVPVFTTLNPSHALQNFLERLYKRACASYTASKTGQDRGIASGTAEVDELEVIGGRKSVITTKSNPNSPSLLPPSSPSSQQDSIGGSSPVSQQSIGDMPSIEYYQPMDHSNNLQKTQDYHMEDNTTHRFEEHTYPSIGKAIHHPMVAAQAPARATSHSYMANHQPMSMAHPGHHSHEAVLRQQHSKAADTWHSQPSSSQTHSQLHHSYPQQNSYVAYAHAVTAEPSHHPPSGTAHYGFQSRPPQEIQNQYEIWRNFMLGFGPVP
ncbi:hypothetical protein DXG03_003835 [Asterophora parasitica]|uniref:Uncharacterized protein n=1 Tax=Asterophora parasitica TaxID=117018 RepID=A0A9P7G7N9_9AGAR|nr:hypothetical protein DXG03_003835 [Asterophora parasitica]